MFAKIFALDAPPPLAAARIHLALLTPHPFSDGNARTGRLAASAVLLRAGFRSSLFTLVEQHFAESPGTYVRSLDRLRFGQSSETECLFDLLFAMARRSSWAAWFARRERMLREACEGAGILACQRDRALREFEGGRAGALARRLSSRLLPWASLRHALTARERLELSEQIGRVLDDERTTGRAGCLGAKEGGFTPRSRRVTTLALGS